MSSVSSSLSLQRLRRRLLIVSLQNVIRVSSQRSITINIIINIIILYFIIVKMYLLE